MEKVRPCPGCRPLLEALQAVLAAFASAALVRTADGQVDLEEIRALVAQYETEA
jgi:hypothetical protein